MPFTPLHRRGERQDMRQILTRTWALIVMIALLPVIGHAQGDGRFTGTVLDQSGALVPGAVVTAKNERTGEERQATSNAEGRFVITGLRPSTYTIKAAFGNFKPLEYTGMQLTAGQEFAIDLQLSPA